VERLLIFSVSLVGYSERTQDSLARHRLAPPAAGFS
jgi:hypothetical protein